MRKLRRLAWTTMLSTVLGSARAADCAPADAIVGLWDTGPDGTLVGLGTIVEIDGKRGVLTALHVVRSSPVAYLDSRAGAPLSVKVGRVWPHHELVFLEFVGPPPNRLPVAIAKSKVFDPTSLRVKVEVGSFDVQRRRSVSSPADLTNAPAGTLLWSNTTMGVCWNDHQLRVTDCAPFPITNPFQIAHVTRPIPAGFQQAPRFEKGDSGAPVFEGDSLVGVVVLHLLNRGQDGVVVPAAITQSSIVSAQNTLPGPTAPSGLHAAARKYAIALRAHTAWRFVAARHACGGAWEGVLSVLEDLEAESTPEAVDSSIGDSLLGPGNPQNRVLPKPPAEGRVATALKATADEPACGEWRAEIRQLVEVLVRLKALERRMGTLQTLWSAAHDALVFPPDAERELLWGARPAENPTEPGAKVMLNPIEKLLEERLPKEVKSLPASSLHERWAEIRSALQACGTSCSGGLVAEPKPPQRLEQMQETLAAAVRLMSPSKRLVDLVQDPAEQAMFWKGLLTSRLLQARRIFAYSSGIEDAVLGERENALSAGPPATGAFRAEVAKIADAVKWSGARLHEASARAAELETALQGLPTGLASAKTLDDVLAAFVADPAALERAFRKRGSDTDLAQALRGARTALDSFDTALGEAIVELMEEPACLGASPAQAGSAAATCPAPSAPAAGASSTAGPGSVPTTATSAETAPTVEPAAPAPPLRSP